MKWKPKLQLKAVKDMSGATQGSNCTDISSTTVKSAMSLCPSSVASSRFAEHCLKSLLESDILFGTFQL